MMQNFQVEFNTESEDERTWSAAIIYTDSTETIRRSNQTYEAWRDRVYQALLKYTL